MLDWHWSLSHLDQQQHFNLSLFLVVLPSMMWMYLLLALQVHMANSAIEDECCQPSRHSRYQKQFFCQLSEMERTRQQCIPSSPTSFSMEENFWFAEWSVNDYSHWTQHSGFYMCVGNLHQSFCLLSIQMMAKAISSEDGFLWGDFVFF